MHLMLTAAGSWSLGDSPAPDLCAVDIRAQFRADLHPLSGPHISVLTPAGYSGF